MAIEIKILDESQLKSANDFFNRIYKTNRPFENFKWEFLEAPAGKAIYVGAVDTDFNNKIVGIQCAIPIALTSSAGEKILTAKSEDTLVDPAYRGQQIFDRMYTLLFEECRKNGIHAIWGFTPAKKAFEKIGFEIPFSSSQALLVRNPFRAFSYLKSLNTQNKRTDHLKILGLSFLSWMKSIQYYFVSSKGASISSTGFTDKSNIFQDLYTGETHFTLDESSAYLNWRILRNPFGNRYASYSISVSNERVVDGVVNTRKDVSYIERLYIKRGFNAMPALKLLIEELKKEPTPLIRVFCFDYNTELATQNKLLAQCGFTLLNRGSFFVWKSLTDAHPINPKQLLLNRLFTQGNQ
jgi:GNAT superfamily N-acetyltransferase